LHRVAVDSPSLEIFVLPFNKSLCLPTWVWGSPCLEQGMTHKMSWGSLKSTWYSDSV